MIKRALAFLLTLALVLALGVSALAAGESYTITITNSSTGHTYQAYQIFAGDLQTVEGKTVLTDIVWGSGITAEGQTALGNAAEKAKSLTTEEDARAFAKAVASYLTNPSVSTAGTGIYTITNLNPGYYLVKDKDNTLTGADDFYTAYLMKVVGNVTAAPKGDKPTLNKQIKHNENGEWGVVGDNQIGDTVEFRTITKVPNTSGYTKYDYIIYDTMSAGLTSNVKSSTDVTIKVNDNDTTVLPAEYYTVTANGNSFSVQVNILKAIRDGKMAHDNELFTYYTGVLNADAKVYDEGKQENAAYLEYSNNPNGEGTGKTPESTVNAWSLPAIIRKVDETGKALTGAKFALSKTGALKIADMNCNDEGIPTVTTDLIGMVKAADGKYRVAMDGDTGVVYVIEAGDPVIKGLDDTVDYYLYETKAPGGYNLLSEPVQFKISASYVEDGSNYTSVTVMVGTAVASDALSTNIVNKTGSTLPETGGVGTTVFYLLGGLLAVGAGVVLVTKKRMNKTDD